MTWNRKPAPFSSMRTWLALVFVAFFCALSTATSTHQGIHFFQGNFKAAKSEAAANKKHIFLDAYTEWCGPCKAMSKNVFTNQKVGSYYNANFVNLKVDMEKGEGLFLSRKYGVNVYPTLLYLDETGKLIKKIEGAMNVTEFLQAGKQAVN